jgi:hypothetical protein
MSIMSFNLDLFSTILDILPNGIHKIAGWIYLKIKQTLAIKSAWTPVMLELIFLNLIEEFSS